MDTGVILYNLRRISFISISIFLVFLLTGCPGEEDCFDMARSTRVNNLIKLLPEQTEYNQGDVVILSLTIPATNLYFSSERNLFQETGDDLARLRLGSFDLFEGNETSYIIGYEENFRLFLPYNSENETYEFKAEITLNKNENYYFVTDETVEIIGQGCDRYIIDTNIEWEGDAMIEFTVTE